MSNALERRDSTRTMFPSLVNFFPDMKSWSVGFDKEWDILEDLQDSFSRGLPAYPPYNIKKISKNEYEIEMAVAGFSKNDIEIVQQEQTLTIEGKKDKEDTSNYVHRGIAARDFKHTFALADYVEVESAKFTELLWDNSQRFSSKDQMAE